MALPFFPPSTFPLYLAPLDSNVQCHFCSLFSLCFADFGVSHAGICFSLADAWISHAKSCLPRLSTMSCSSNAAFGGILLFLVFCFDLFFVFCLSFWVEDVRWILTFGPRRIRLVWEIISHNQKISFKNLDYSYLRFSLPKVDLFNNLSFTWISKIWCHRYDLIVRIFLLYL